MDSKVQALEEEKESALVERDKHWEEKVAEKNKEWEKRVEAMVSGRGLYVAPMWWIPLKSGPYLIIKTVFPGMAISIMIRRLWDRLIFTMGICYW